MVTVCFKPQQKISQYFTRPDLTQIYSQFSFCPDCTPLYLVHLALCVSPTPPPQGVPVISKPYATNINRVPSHLQKTALNSSNSAIEKEMCDFCNLLYIYLPAHLDLETV